jgi:predicted ATPase/DNA-binding SARP family transcriptional activator
MGHLSEVAVARALLGELQIRLLGTPSLAFDGETVRFRAPARAMALLAYLLLHPELLRRDRVAWALWPDVPEQTARANLRRHLHLLRDTLPDISIPWFVGDARTVAWNRVAPARVDVYDFERLSEEAETRGAAANLYAGDLAPAIDDEWIGPIRERLHDRQVANLFELIQQNQRRGDLSQALEYAQLLVRFDPWHEPGIRSLVVLRHAAGDRAGALQEYLQFVQRVRDELGVEPMPETVAAYQTILADGDVTVGSGETGIDDFPRPTTSFHGRGEEVARICSDVAKRRIVTLCGPGGVGKTRLATEVGLFLRERFRNGIHFVDLASLEAGAQLAEKVAFALRVQEQRGSRIVDSIVMELRTKNMLIVIDNCEHVTEPLAECVQAIAEYCPDVRMLLTSRAPVGVAGEVVRRIEPFLVESNDDASTNAAENPAIALFLDRAADRQPGLASTADLSDVARICRMLDGLPLAIELAAGLMGALSLETLGRNLNDRMRLSGSVSRTPIQRQRNLRATLAWGYDLLVPAEARLFRQLGVFRGSFTAEGVCAIGAGAQGVEADETLLLLAALVEKSMVSFHVLPGAAARYRMLDSTRAYARELLAASGETADCERHHARFHREAARRASAAYGGTPDRQWLAILTPANDDFLAALDWTLVQGHDVAAGVDLAASLTDLWLVTGRESQGIEWLQRAAMCDCDARAAAAVWSGLGVLYRRSYRFGEAVDASRRALHIFEALGDERAMTRDLTTLGVSLASVPDSEGTFATVQGRPLVERALSIARRHGDHFRIAEALFGLGIIAAYGGYEPAAMDWFEAALAMFRSLGKATRLDNCLLSIAITAYALGDLERAAAISHQLLESRTDSIPHVQLGAVAEVLGCVALERGDTRTAAAEFRRALTMAADTEMPAFVDVRLANFALLEEASRNDIAAARYFGYVEQRAAEGSWSAMPFYRRRDEAVAARVKGRLGDAAFDDARREGRAMDRAAMVATALYETGSAD